MASWLLGTKHRQALRPPSEREQAVLQANQDLLTQPFSLDKPHHEEMLRELWGRLNCAKIPEGSPGFLDPTTTFKPVDEAWTEFGFQQKDPVSDIRGGGVLSIQLLLYFLVQHRATAEAMMMQQRSQIASRDAIALTGVSRAYPFAAAGINVTRVVAQVFGLVGEAGNKTMFADEKKTFWTLADEFNEVYCVVFRLMDRVWTEMDADYMMFKQVSGGGVSHVCAPSVRNASLNLSDLIMSSQSHRPPTPPRGCAFAGADRGEEAAVQRPGQGPADGIRPRGDPACRARRLRRRGRPLWARCERLDGEDPAVKERAGVGDPAVHRGPLAEALLRPLPCQPRALRPLLLQDGRRVQDPPGEV